MNPEPMKVIKIMLLFATMAMAANVWAKEKENVKVDSNFFWINKDQSFEPYEPVLLNGTYNVQSVKSIKLNYQMNNMPFSVVVAMANGNWSASVGSFLPHQSIVLNFDVQIEADKEKIQELRNQFVNKFSEVTDGLIKKYVPEDSSIEVFQSKIILGVNKGIKEDFDIFKDENGISLRDHLMKGLKSQDKLNRLCTSVLKINRKEKGLNINLDAIEHNLSNINNSTKSLMKDYVAFFKNPKNNEKPVIDTLTIDSIIKPNVIRLEKYWSQLEAEKKGIKVLIDSIVPSERILATISYQKNLRDNKELKFALKNFIGFEVMPVYFLDRNLNSTFGLFFTASPYFGWIDPDEKIFQKCKNPTYYNNCHSFKYSLYKLFSDKILWDNLKRFVTPTLGFSLGTSPKTNQVTPLVYAGIGLRMNNIVRVSIGKTFYTQKFETSTNGTDPVIKSGNCWTLGIGISTDYLSDFLKIFSTTINQFGK